MDETAFWTIIDQARPKKGRKAPSADVDRLRKALEPLSDDEIKAFSVEFTRQLVRLNRWAIWAAGYIAAGGLSDDGFRYFRSWLVGKGKEAVEQALQDPDGLANYFDEDGDEEEFENEELEYIAIEILQGRGVAEDPRGDAGNPDATPEGSAFDEETVYDDYPRLAALFG